MLSEMTCLHSLPPPFFNIPEMRCVRISHHEIQPTAAPQTPCRDALAKVDTTVESCANTLEQARDQRDQMLSRLGASMVIAVYGTPRCAATRQPNPENGAGY